MFHFGHQRRTSSVNPKRQPLDPVDERYCSRCARHSQASRYRSGASQIVRQGFLRKTTRLALALKVSGERFAEG
jgi:hypothetical protein